MQSYVDFHADPISTSRVMIQIVAKCPMLYNAEKSFKIFLDQDQYADDFQN